MGKRPVKVFCIGAHKTGTSSMGAALASLGFSVFPETAWYADRVLRDDFYEGRYPRLARLIDQYDAFEDSPFNLGRFYAWLYEHYPDAKFIMTVRDAERLVASHKRWLARLKTLVFPKDSELEEFVRFYWQHEYRQGEFIDNEPVIREIYEARNRAVADFFKDKPGALLTLDLDREPEPWRPLCSFLNVDVPAVPFPHLKRSQ